MPNLTRSPRSRLGAVAGILGASAALTVVTGAGPVPSIFQLAGATTDISGPCDEAEHAADPACAGALVAGQDDDTTTTTVDGTTSSTVTDGEVRTIDAGAAGSAMVSVSDGSLLLLTASPNQGWSVEVEQASGPEVEVTFRSGATRVDLNVELEDGQMRVRVRTRDEATGTDSRVETPEDDSRDDSSGPGSGSDDSADEPDDADDDSSGPGSDDDEDDELDDSDDSDDGSDDSSDDSSDEPDDDSSGHD